MGGDFFFHILWQTKVGPTLWQTDLDSSAKLREAHVFQLEPVRRPAEKNKTKVKIKVPFIGLWQIFGLLSLDFGLPKSLRMTPPVSYQLLRA